MEVFHREGKKFSKEQIHEMMMQADPKHKGKLGFDDFTRLMRSTFVDNNAGF